MLKLKKLDTSKVDFNNHAGPGTGPFWVQKDVVVQVTHAKVGQIAQTGEKAGTDCVAIYAEDADIENTAPLYVMDAHKFFASSTPKSNNLDLSGDVPSYWYLEDQPRRAVFIAEEHGPFHLAAPAHFGQGHDGWDVTTVLEFFEQLPEGGKKLIAAGYMLTETSGGPMHDKKAIEAGHYMPARQETLKQYSVK